MKPRKMTTLKNLKTAHHWQCAHDALTHAHKGEKITLTYATPDGDLTLTVAVGVTSIIIERVSP